MTETGKLQRVEDLRRVWRNDEKDFTPWLARAENIRVLAETLGMDLEVEAQNAAQGNRAHANILCKDLATGNRVVIECQLGMSHHEQLGHMLSYAAGLQAVTVVWITAELSDKHRSALQWLNNATDDWFRFFGLEVELWRIGDSPLAPRFNVVSKPRRWIPRGLGLKSEGLTANQQSQLEFWTGFTHRLEEKQYRYSAIPKPRPQNWMSFAIGRKGFSLSAVAAAWYLEEKVFGGELRLELVLSYQDSKAYFEELLKQHRFIRQQLGEKPIWYQRNNVNMCRVFVQRAVEDVYDRAGWDEHRQWLHDRLIRFQKVFRPIIAQLQIPAGNSQD